MVNSDKKYNITVGKTCAMIYNNCSLDQYQELKMMLGNHPFHLRVRNDINAYKRKLLPTLKGEATKTSFDFRELTLQTIQAILPDNYKGVFNDRTSMFVESKFGVD